MRQLKNAVNVLICSKSFFINLTYPHYIWMRLDLEPVQLARAKPLL
jgi:hypothetical protein